MTVAGQELTIYEGSQPLIEAMVADIAASNTRVDGGYIFADDAAGPRWPRRSPSVPPRASTCG